MIDTNITVTTLNPAYIIDTLRGLADKLESVEFIHVSGGIVVDIAPLRDGNSLTVTADLTVAKLLQPVEIEWAGEDWFIAHWPDGTWCNWEDRYEFIDMWGGCEKQRVISYDHNGYVPIRTERMPT